MNGIFKKSSAPMLPEGSKWKRRFNDYRILIPCMLIPVVIMYLIYVSKAHYPFGEGSVLVLDLNAQYVWFFEALRNFVKGDASLLYSFARSLGGEFMGIYAYYIASPLSYIVCLFPQDRMLEGLLTLFLLKTAISAGTFAFYMKKTEKQMSGLSLIIFSTFYALSSYAVVQQHNTMWIDALMWLPLITLGIEQLVKYGKFKTYTVFLALTVFSSYYIGYMVCIYCFFYFFLYYLAHNEDDRNNPLKEKLHFLKSLLRIAFYSLIAIGIAAVIILCAYYSLNFGKTTFSDPDWSVNLSFDILDLLYKFLPGSYDTVRPEGLPFVYCGLLTLLLLPAYFLSNKYSMRQKIVSGIFVFVFVASFTLNVADLVWHGFQFPNWLNYRYSFMLTFYLCVLGCRAFSDFDNISLKTVMGTGGLIALLCVILQKYEPGTDVIPDDYMTIWFSLIVIFAYLALLGLLRKTTDKQLISIFLVAAVAVEVFLNGLWNLNGLDYDVVYTDYTSYNGFLNETRPIVEAVQNADDSFYRMEKVIGSRTNDNMALKIRGLTGSTSTLNEETIRFLNKMGYSSQSHWSTYGGGTPVNDSLLGIKYVIAESGSVYESYYEEFAIDKENGHTAYLNPYALSIAYGVNDGVLSFPLGFKSTVDDLAPGVENAEDEEESKIASAVDALKNKLNDILGIEETLREAEYVDDYDSPMDRLNAIITAMLGEDELVQVFVPVPIKRTNPYCTITGLVAAHTRYEPDPLYAAEEEAYVGYDIVMPEDAELFFYLPSDYPREINLMLEKGEERMDKGTFYGGETSCIISLGEHKANDKMTLEMYLTTDYLYVKKGVDVFYYIDWDVYESVMERLAKDQLVLTDYTEDSFEGTFTASLANELVMTTIPYDAGWKIYVDGVEVETHKALGALVSFYVEGEAGETHDVKMIYRPDTLKVGLIVSGCSLALLILLIVFEKKLRRVPVLKSVVGIPAIEQGDVALALDVAVEELTDPAPPEAPEAEALLEQAEADDQSAQTLPPDESAKPDSNGQPESPTPSDDQSTPEQKG